MAFRVEQDGESVHFIVPKGDTIVATVTSSGDASVVWTGWTWTAQARTRDSLETLVGTFSVVDTSTTNQLNLALTLSSATTDALTEGTVYKWALKGTKSGTVRTYVEGQIRVTDKVVI